MMKKLSISNLVDATDVAVTTSWNLGGVDRIQPKEIYAKWTVTSCSATIAVQTSHDGTTWVNTATPIAVTATGSTTIAVDRHAPYYRVNFVRTSGDADTLQVYVSSLSY